MEEALPNLEKYSIVRKLAAGGMASIFVAEQKGSGEICVVKTLHDHLAKDSVVGSRFLREARVASELRHPNIARLMDAKSENGVFYLAMEFIAGHDLESMMFRLMEQRKMLPPELSVRVTLDVLEGLHYAHDYVDAGGKHLEIVHRDLSPRNVMITYEGEVKIIDFGLARTNMGDFRTAPGMVLGTLRYMSPEQAVAEEVDRRSDLYSWAVVLYEMLSGRPLVSGSNAQEILHAVVTRMAPPLSMLNASLPKALDAVLEKGMAKEREDRFATAAEMAEAIRTAAPELCRTKPHKIGRFVASVFPDERMTDHLASRSSEGPEIEPTRAGQELTAASVPSPLVEEVPHAPEHFVPTNIYVAPSSLHSMPAARAPRRRRPLLWAAALLAVASLLAAVGITLVPRPKVEPQPALAMPASPEESPVARVPQVVAKEAPAPAERSPPAPPSKPKPAEHTARKTTPAPPAEPAPPPPKAPELKRYPWEARVRTLLKAGRDGEASNVLQERAAAIGAPHAKACAYDNVFFGRPLDPCIKMLLEAEEANR